MSCNETVFVSFCGRDVVMPLRVDGKGTADKRDYRTIPAATSFASRRSGLYGMSVYDKQYK